jgi:hypothetical protein
VVGLTDFLPWSVIGAEVCELLFEGRHALSIIAEHGARS